MFNWLQSSIAGTNCLDLFAGSGALGIEAVSRGAANSTLVEQDRKTAENLRQSIQILDADELIVCETDALRWVQSANQTFDIIFLDPPFGTNLIENSLKLLFESACVSEQTLFYIESESEWQAGKKLEVIKQAKAGQVNYMLLKKW